MFDQTALRGFMHEVDVNVTKLTSTQAVELLVNTAEEVKHDVIASAMSRSGIAPSYRQIVDGREGAPLQSVRPDGVIVFAWQYVDEMIIDTYGALVNRLPRLTGRARASVIVLADGVEVDIAAVPEGVKEVRLVVTVPYARRLEVGRKKHSHEPFSRLGFHAVEETAIVAKRLWGAIGSISFNYTDISNAYGLKTGAGIRRREWSHARQGWRTDAGPRRRPGIREVESEVRYPTIIILPRSA